VAGIREKYGLSERHACRLVSQPRGTQRYVPTVRADEDALTRAIVALASEYGRYGYRRITALLQIAGWRVGKDRVQRIWRREGLKVPQKHRPRGRLWLNDGSCIRLRPERPNHVWSFDFVEGQTHDGRSLRILTLIDEYTRECLALRVERRINSFGVLETLADAMLQKGVPEHVRCDNGPEMIAKALREWLAKLGRRRGSHRRFDGLARGPGRQTGLSRSDVGIVCGREENLFLSSEHHAAFLVSPDGPAGPPTP